MKTLLATLATCAVLSFDASADAASLGSIQGMVQINSGSGFHQVAQVSQVAGSAELAPGNSVMVAAGASAEIRYSDDCRIPVRPGSVAGCTVLAMPTAADRHRGPGRYTGWY
jgi:hypothetical protein